MSSIQDIANYRTSSIVRLKTEHAENNAKIEELQARNAEIRASQRRLELPLPKPNACPICFYQHGVTSEIFSVPANPQEPGVDQFRCPNGHDF
jgi:hypothetical protein